MDRIKQEPSPAHLSPIKIKPDPLDPSEPAPPPCSEKRPIPYHVTLKLATRREMHYVTLRATQGTCVSFSEVCETLEERFVLCQLPERGTWVLALVDDKDQESENKVVIACDEDVTELFRWYGVGAHKTPRCLSGKFVPRLSLSTPSPTVTTTSSSNTTLQQYGEEQKPGLVLLKGVMRPSEGEGESKKRKVEWA